MTSFRRRICPLPQKKPWVPQLSWNGQQQTLAENFTPIINTKETKYLPEIYIFAKSIFKEMLNKQNFMFIFFIWQTARCFAIFKYVHQCCRNSSDLSDNRTFFMNVRQKLKECRTKCPTENIKISIWWMKRSETQVTIKDNNYVLCHLAVFVGTGSTLNFRWSTFFF